MVLLYLTVAIYHSSQYHNQKCFAMQQTYKHSNFPSCFTSMENYDEEGSSEEQDVHFEAFVEEEEEKEEETNEDMEDQPDAAEDLPLHYRPRPRPSSATHLQIGHIIFFVGFLMFSFL